MNVNQLVDFYRPRADVEDTRPLTEEDFAGIAAQGFNVVRLGLSWSALEPERGEFDQAYVDQITEAVDWAKQHGDLHGARHAPGRLVERGHAGGDRSAARAPTRCGATTAHRCGRPSPTGRRAASSRAATSRPPATARSRTSTSTPTACRRAFVATWAKLAAAFRDEPAVAGFDLLNEPGFGETAPVTTSFLLGRFYDRAIDAIRAEGAPQIVFIEPSILWSGLGFDSGPTPGFTTDTNLVFSPHLYAESITMDRSLGLPPIVSMERQFELATRAADSYGMPLWSGEYGYWGDDADRVQRLTRYADLEDEYILGSAYWVWKQACGDPQGGINDMTDSLMRQYCATGDDAPARDDLLEILSRAYPRSAPGVLTSLDRRGSGCRARRHHGRRGLRTRGVDSRLDGAGRQTTGVTEVETTAVAGGWSVTGCAEGDYTLSTNG